MRRGRPRRPAYVVVEWSGGGGIGHYAFLLADGLARRGVHAVLATRAGHELAALPHAHRTAALWPRAPRRLRGRARRAAVGAGWALGWARLVGAVAGARLGGRHLAVHVQAPETRPEALLLAALRRLGPTLLITAHNAVPHDRAAEGAELHRATYRTPHGIVVQGADDARLVRALAGPGPRIAVVAHGTYAPLADGLAGPVPPPAPEGVVRVAHLGTIRPYKGFDVVVEAFRLAHARDRRLHLRVVGRAADPAGALALLGTLPEGSWSADLGWVDVGALAREARAADVLLLGHRRASESGILHLALASGTPVAGPDLAGIGRLLAAHPGWRYRPGDPGDAARALAGLAAATRADRAGVRRAARAVADTSAPGWDAVADRHLELLAAIDGPERWAYAHMPRHTPTPGAGAPPARLTR